MADEKTPNGFHYVTPNDRSTSIIVTGLASMGGTSGSKFGLIDPDSQGTTLLAKINGYFFGFFQAGTEWGRERGLKNIEQKSNADTVHAEEYFLAALTDSWKLLTVDGIIKEGEAPSISIKLTKTPCSGCAPQLVEFVKNQNCTVRIKAAQLWGHRSNQAPHNITALDDLGSAGIAVIPWDLLAKVGKNRKDFSKHELGFLDKGKFSSKEVDRLQAEYKILRESLGLKEDTKLEERRKDYKNKGLSKEAALAYSKEMAAQIVTDITGKMSKMDSELNTLTEELQKVSETRARQSPRKAVKEKTDALTTKQKEELLKKKQKLEKEQLVLEKRKGYYQTMETN